MNPTRPITEIKDISTTEKSTSNFNLKNRIMKLKISQKLWRIREYSKIFHSISNQYVNCNVPIDCSAENVEWLKRTNAKDTGTGGFHEAVGSVLALAQFFAIMPVVGVRSDGVSRLKFEWKSIRTIYAMILLISLTLYLGLTLYIMRKREMSFDAISTSVRNL